MADPALYFDEDGALRLYFGTGMENFRQPICPECEKPIRWNLDKMSFTPPPFQRLAHARCVWWHKGFAAPEVVEHIGPTKVEDGPGVPSDTQSDDEMADSMTRTMEEAQRAVDVYKLVRKFDEDAILPEEVRVFHQDDWDSWAELAGCEPPNRHTQLLAIHVLWELEGGPDPDEDGWSDDNDWDPDSEPDVNRSREGFEQWAPTRMLASDIAPLMRRTLIGRGLAAIEVDSAIKMAETEFKRVRDKQRIMDGVHRDLLKGGLSPSRLSEALSVADRILDGVHARVLDSIQRDAGA